MALPHEAYVDVRAGGFDVRAGLATTVWGRLDEIQPTDVINPLDVSRFVFEGRAAARLPVLQTKVRWFANESTTVEGVWVPIFRRGRFDALDEPSSPFNVIADARSVWRPFRLHCDGAGAHDATEDARELAGRGSCEHDDATGRLVRLGISRHPAVRRPSRFAFHRWPSFHRP